MQGTDQAGWSGAQGTSRGTPGGSAGTPSAFVQGVIERITYRHPDSGYSVLRLSPERGQGDPEAMYTTERLTAVGTTLEAGEGQRVRLGGTWTTHAQHGRQFRFQTLSVLPPLSKDGLVRYLSSSAFHGVGPKLAERIVDALGTAALSRIRDDPESLVAVKGLKPKVRADLVAAVQRELGSQEALAFLYGVGLGPAQASLVLKALGPDAETRLRANPYLLARGISGIGFRIADRVAKEMGITDDAPERLQAALLHSLREAVGQGNTCVELTGLAREAAALTDSANPAAPSEDATPSESVPWQEHAEVLAREGVLVLDTEIRPDTTLAYLPAYHTSELLLAENLAALAGVGAARPLADERQLAAVEDALDIALHADQRRAVLGLLSSPVALLTGGPGVGKTTIIEAVVRLAEAASARVVLASPTGRAAKRLAEATGRDASTIHRLLGFEPGTSRFQHTDKHPIEADLVIVDEISMLDVTLAHHLVKAIQPPTRLLLIGDPDQLPSVQAGNVLADLLSSERIPAFRLTHIYRQGEGSLIVENAHRILAGEMPTLPARGDASSDFYFFPAEEDEDAATRLIEVVTKRIPTRFGFDWERDVQVLSPMYKGACGVDALNERLRDALGFGGRQLVLRGRTWRVGDRVIHTRNDYERHVFNGDMGRIVRVHEDGTGLVVRFPERELPYTANELTDLSPAFAITVHRSQGGEYPVVVLPLVNRHFTMLERHLFYTAITRAKELLVLVGSKRALRRAVENSEVHARESALRDRLAARLPIPPWTSGR